MLHLHEIPSYISWAVMNMFSILLASWTSVFKIEEDLNSSMYKLVIWKQKAFSNFCELESVVSGGKMWIFINRGVFWDENENPWNNKKNDQTLLIVVELQVFSDTAVLVYLQSFSLLFSYCWTLTQIISFKTL